MRWIQLPILAMVLSGLCTAQQAQQPEVVERNGWSIEFVPSPPESDFHSIIVTRPGEPDRTIWVNKTRGCFALRVYHFEREGTEAPRITGQTTCTFLDEDVLRWTKRPSKARLVPAN